MNCVGILTLNDKFEPFILKKSLQFKSFWVFNESTFYFLVDLPSVLFLQSKWFPKWTTSIGAFHKPILSYK